MSPCWFLDNKNPITNKKCREAFSTMQNNYSSYPIDTTEDLISQLYFSSLGIFGIYVLLKLFERKM